MDRELFRRLQAVVDEALDLPAEERPARIAARCGGDGELWREVERFLAAEQRSHGFLEAPLGKQAAGLLGELRQELGEAEDLTGRRVGAFRVLRELGRGGMGAVYLAERADGRFEQRVALKVVRRHPGSAAVQQRFLAERRILARLRHPGIASLIDGGATEDGSPYFVLEYVEGGVLLTTYCTARGLGVEERLRLFEQVGQAVAHAHRNLVVHRDLKPSNVLVTPEGRAKLLDFGIAKLLAAEGEDAADATATSLGHRPMTPCYAAPEQILGESVTTATDVYGLGAMLFELLTGELPVRAPASTPGAVERAVLEQEPPRPSRAAVQAAGEGGDPAERGRRRRLARRLRGDLDAIVLKALAKRPERRYRSVEALLRDLDHHRRGLPVAARSGGAGDRLWRFVRRHRAAVAAAAVVLLSLVAGGAATVWQARKAVAEARRAEEVKGFVLRLFEVTDPDGSRGGTLTARDLLDRGARRLEFELARQPETRAEMLTVVGDIYRRLGAYEEAEETLRRSLALRRERLGEHHPEVGETLLRLADVHHTRGELERAGELYRQALALLREGLGGDHRLTLEAESYAARLLLDQGRSELAEPALRQVLERQRRLLGERDPAAVETLNALATALFARGAYAESEPLFAEVLEVRRELFGEAHTAVSAALINLASVRDRLGDGETAEGLYRRALDIDRRLLPGHPDLAVGLNNLADLLLRRGDHRQAEALAREAVAVVEAALGKDHPASAPYLHNLARILRLGGEPGSAEPLARRALALAEASLGREHEKVGLARLSLAQCLLAEGKLEEAEPAFRDSLQVLRRRLSPADPHLGEGLLGLGRLLAESGRGAEAEPLLRDAVESLRRSDPADPRIAELTGLLASRAAQRRPGP